MSIQSISINDILIDKSRFSLKRFLFETNSDRACLEKSFKNLGILHPVVVLKEGEKQLHLIDGKKRIQFAKQNQINTVRATVLSESILVTDIITLILCNKINEINLSVMNKVQFICFAIYLSAPGSWVIDSLCIPFGFKPYSEFLHECKSMNNLPKGLKLFCHEKNFSLKQILNLTYYPEDVLIQLINWKSELQLTASILDEIASNLKDYLKSYNKTVSDFVSEPGVQEVFESSLSPRDKTQILRQLIYLKCFPILSSVNARIQNTIKNLGLPHEININWDSSLENKNIDLIVHLKDPKKWQKALDTLNSKKVKDAIKLILKEL